MLTPDEQTLIEAMLPDMQAAHLMLFLAQVTGKEPAEVFAAHKHAGNQLQEYMRSR